MATGAPPRKRAKSGALGAFRESRWFVLVWLVPVLAVVAVGAVLLARWLRTLTAVADFIATYPGEYALPEWAPIGIPAWIGWQHFFNAFLLVLIIRSGWQVRQTKRPPAFWTRHNRGILRTKRQPRKMSLHLWWHLTLDALWLLNGIVFVVLLFATGHWVRIVPTSWEVFPNALSAGIQYVSFDWPTENGWVNYNSLQQLTYFLTVFVAAPLAAITGARMSELWPPDSRLNRVYKVEWARALHFPVMLYFVLFIIVHVTLVLATGALRNLNHMYAANDGDSWWGAGIFALSLAVMAGAVVAAQPVVLRPIAALMGKVSR